MRTHIDLFSGIGGFALAARWAGIKTVQFVEIDKFCHKVLKKNFPGVPIHDDIKTFTNTDRPKDDATQNNNRRGKSVANNGAEVRSFNSASSGTNRPFLLTGGFPCQPFSCAGKRKGTEDDRHLWPEMLRVIKEFKPTWIIGENVAGIRSMELVNSDSAVESNPDIQEDGENDYTTVLDGICNDLEGIGYEVQPIIIPACAVGAPHRRDRVWFVAHAINGEYGTCTGQIRETDGLQGINREALRSGWIERTDSHAPDTTQRKDNQRNGRSMDTPERSGECSDSAVSVGDKYVTNTEKSECEQSGNSRTGREGFANDNINVSNSEGERLEGSFKADRKQGQESHDQLLHGCRGEWDENWHTVALRTCVRSLDDGLPAGLARPKGWRVNSLKALGNAIVPQVAFEIMKAIVAMELEGE